MITITFHNLPNMHSVTECVNCASLLHNPTRRNGLSGYWLTRACSKVTLLEAIKRGLKKGSSKEQQLSAQALSLLVITIGAGSEEIYKDVSPLLEEIINNPSVQEEVRAAVCASSHIVSPRPQLPLLQTPLLLRTT